MFFPCPFYNQNRKKKKIKKGGGGEEEEKKGIYNKQSLKQNKTKQRSSHTFFTTVFKACIIMTVTLIFLLT